MSDRTAGHGVEACRIGAKAFPYRHIPFTALVIIVAFTPAYGQDVAAGQKLFRSHCSTCHSPQPDRNITGPSLFGVVGRHSGRVPSFHYSQANLGSGLTWDPATLDRYLTSPKQVVPGTRMSFPGLTNARDRADVIAYLTTLH